MKTTVALLSAILLVGCSGTPTGPLPHTATEQNALSKYNNMSPQEKIDFIQKGQMPDGAKQAQIDKIKQQYGLK